MSHTATTAQLALALALLLLLLTIILPPDYLLRLLLQLLPPAPQMATLPAADQPNQLHELLQDASSVTSL